MNIDKIKQIVNLPLPKESIEQGIIEVLAKDERVVTTVMRIIAAERQQKEELIKEMNLLLSKADTGLDNPKLNKGSFMQKEIATLYEKYKDIISHCFKQSK